MKTTVATDYLLIAITIALTVYDQLVFKWQVNAVGQIPTEWGQRIEFFVRLVLNPWMISAFAAAFLGSLTWAAALTRFDLSFAYPFTSLAYILVLVLSAALFSESITAPKVIGIGLIIVGVYVVSRG